MDGGENMRWTLGEVLDFVIGAAITVGVATLDFGASYVPSRGGVIAACIGCGLTAIGILVLLIHDQRSNSPTKLGVLLAVIGGVAAAIDAIWHGHLVQIFLQVFAGIALISYGWFARGLEEKRRAKASQQISSKAAT